MGLNGKWLNPGKFQIISAGPDLAFGAGSYMKSISPLSVRAWTPGDPNSEYISSSGGAPIFGYDDLANFNALGNLGEAAGN